MASELELLMAHKAFDLMEKDCDSLRQQNIELLAVIEQKSTELKDIRDYLGPLDRNNFSPVTKAFDIANEALALSPSSEALEARDRVRDAKLLRSLEPSIPSVGGVLELLARGRESGEWKPEL